MCLFTYQEKPKIAEHDIHVFKILEGNKTPYRGRRVYFLFGRAFMRSRLIFEPCGTDDYRCYNVNIGIHAFYVRLRAIEERACLIQQRHRSITYSEIGKNTIVIYHAIIPEGAKYGKGPVHDGDIASNKLIIFKTEKDYNAYLAKHK